MERELDVDWVEPKVGERARDLGRVADLSVDVLLLEAIFLLTLVLGVDVGVHSLKLQPDFGEQVDYVLSVHLSLFLVLLVAQLVADPRDSRAGILYDALVLLVLTPQSLELSLLLCDLSLEFPELDSVLLVVVILLLGVLAELGLLHFDSQTLKYLFLLIQVVIPGLDVHLETVSHILQFLESLYEFVLIATIDLLFKTVYLVLVASQGFI